MRDGFENGRLRLSRDNVSTAVSGFLREAINNGLLAPGERLKEVELARELGISRTPIREALLILQTEGLVEISPKRGASVRTYDSSDLEDIYQLRALLEGHAAYRAATRLSRRSVEQLRRSCERFERIPAGSRLRELMKENLLFHNIILAAAGSRRLAEIVQSLVVFPLVYRSHLLYSSEQKLMTVNSHWQLVNALEARDGGRAQMIMKAHVLDAGDFLVAQIRAIEKQSVAAAAEAAPRRKRPSKVS